MKIKEVTADIRESFPHSYQQSVLGIRTALTELLLAAGADPARPRDISRRFDLNKNLTWMVSKIVTSNDVYAIAQHIPGPTRIESLLGAMEKAGATGREVTKLRAALADFDEMVARHTGDRETLEMMLAEMSPAAQRADQLVQNRKLAFKGNSGTLGVQAKVQLGGAIVAPNADDPTRADLVQVGGLFGFRRLRSSARWLLFRRMRWEDDGRPSAAPVDEPLTGGPNGLPLLPEFCSQPAPDIRVIAGPDETQYELPAGPVGNAAALTCVYGSVLRQTGTLRRDEHDQWMELGCSLVTPAEMLVFDLLVHESMSWALEPELAVYTRIQSSTAHESSSRDRNRMVISEQVSQLGRGIAALVTPHMPRHVELLQTVFDRVGWNAQEFHALRVQMEFPPIPATLLLRSQLPEA